MADKDKLHALSAGLLLFFYVGLLWLLKLHYKKMNAYLINKKLVDEKYAGKDFTHVELSDSGDDIWDNKIAAAPSWFDYATSFILFLLPILLIGLISTIAECIFG